MSFHRVASTEELSVGNAKLVQIGDKIVALFRLEDGWYAIDDRCSHRGGPLSEGKVEGNEVTCPWHFAKFDLKTGKAIAGVAPRGQACYPVRVTGNDVEIDV